MYLDSVPVRTGEVAPQEDYTVVLLMPRYPTAFGRLVGKLLNRSRNVRIRLDSIGGAVWRLIDGRRSVREIGDAVRGEFGDGAEPVYPRLVEFMEILRKNGFVRLSEACEVRHVE